MHIRARAGYLEDCSVIGRSFENGTFDLPKARGKSAAKAHHAVIQEQKTARSTGGMSAVSASMPLLSEQSSCTPESSSESQSRARYQTNPGPCVRGVLSGMNSMTEFSQGYTGFLGRLDLRYMSPRIHWFAEPKECVDHVVVQISLAGLAYNQAQQFGHVSHSAHILQATSQFALPVRGARM